MVYNICESKVYYNNKCKDREGRNGSKRGTAKGQSGQKANLWE